MEALLTQDRTSVAVIGEVDIKLRDALSARGLLTKTLEDVASVTECLDVLRAIVLLYPTGGSEDDIRTFARQASAIIAPALNSGVLPVFCLSPAIGDDGNQRLEFAIARASGIIAGIVASSNDDRLKVFTADDIDSLAERCARHIPGNARNDDLNITGVPAGLDTEELRTLLQRAFGDFAEVHIEQLTGGLTETDVWKLTAREPSGLRTEPFVVKMGAREAISAEIEETLRVAEHYVPFPHRPPIIQGRCVEGFRKKLMVSMFVARAVRFDRYVSAVSPKLAIAAIFDGPLRSLRRNRRSMHVQLGLLYESYGLLKKIDSPEMHAAYDVAVSRGFSPKEPASLYRAIMSAPYVDIDVCAAHGDLHLKNIWVRENQVDVVLIDLEKANFESAVSRDPAILDVSLAYDTPKPVLDEASLRQLYCPRALRSLVPDIDDTRVSAIEQLRLQASASCRNEYEYDFALAVCLLRLARKMIQTDRVGDAGLAYDLASTLALAALQAMTKTNAQTI